MNLNPKVYLFRIFIIIANATKANPLILINYIFFNKIIIKLMVIGHIILATVQIKTFL